MEKINLAKPAIFAIAGFFLHLKSAEAAPLFNSQFFSHYNVKYFLKSIIKPSGGKTIKPYKESK